MHIFYLFGLYQDYYLLFDYIIEIVYQKRLLVSSIMPLPLRNPIGYRVMSKVWESNSLMI